MKIEGVISLYSESVKLAERSAVLCEQDDNHEKANDWREDANFCRQMIEWLRELQERRKAPEIVRCGECKHCDPEDKKCDCGHDIIWQLPRDDDWYCADAERRTDG